MDIRAMDIRNYVGDTVDAIFTFSARRATKYLSPKMVISAARPFHKNAPWRKNDTRVGIVLKIGAPNYEERDFIKRCQRVGESFPVKKIQLKFPPKGPGK